MVRQLQENGLGWSGLGTGQMWALDVETQGERWDNGVATTESRKRDITTESWKQGVTTESWKQGVTTESWKQGVTTESWKRDITTEPWKRDMEVRKFRTFDGTWLTYYVTGEVNRPAMVIANGLGGNMRAWRHFLSFFAPLFRIYIWDYRGLFQSEQAPSLEDYTIHHHSEDLVALMEHEAIEQPVLVGWSMGVQVILEFLRRHQEKARAFIALNGTFGQPFQTAFHSDFLQKRFEGVFQFVKRNWERAIWLRPHVSRTSVVQAFIRSMQIAGIAGRTIDKDAFFDMSTEFLYNDLQVYSEIFVQLGKHNAYDALSAIATPALVIAGTRDSFIPARVSKEMSQRMKNGEYWEIPGATHFCPLEYPHTVNMRVRDYLFKR